MSFNQFVKIPRSDIEQGRLSQALFRPFPALQNQVRKIPLIALEKGDFKSPPPILPASQTGV
jgi:hypothetical protein